MKGLATFGPLVLLIVIMYFLLIRPQKKREKETKNMRDNLCVGDEIVTIGGVKGKVVKTREDSIVLQVGAEKIKIEMMRWAISKVIASPTREAKRKQRQDEQAKVEAAEENEQVEDQESQETQKKPQPKRMKKAAPKKEEADTVVEADDEKQEPEKKPQPKRMKKAAPKKEEAAETADSDKQPEAEAESNEASEAPSDEE